MEDVKTVWKLLTSKQYREETKQHFKKIGKEAQRVGLKNIVKEYWYFYALMAAFFFLGWGLAGFYYSGKCNEILIERGCVTLVDTLGTVVRPLLNLTNLTI